MEHRQQLPATVVAASLIVAMAGLGASASAAQSSAGEADPLSINGPRVVLETSLGEIVVEVDVARAPITAGNFLRYVDGGHFRGATFYRAVRADNQPDNPVTIDVIQGGLEPEDDAASRFPPIAHETTHETGIRHEDGVISMARLGPGTATTEFFICVGDQRALDFGGKRNPDRQGFAAFGRVVEGIGVVREIHRQPADGQWLEPKVEIRQIYRQ